ncbi:MAG: hypothetical protein PHC34_12880 [Candidatus Gastranaerophilales bacterium]|nr:hypothetical protein [Candidatus Gastranaerophilales bacterium]
MLNNINEIKLQNISFGNGKIIPFRPRLNESVQDRFEKSSSKEIELSRNGKQVKNLLIKLQSIKVHYGKYNPEGLFTGEIENLINILEKKEFYRAFLEVVQECQELKRSDIPPGEAYRPSIAPHKDYTKEVYPRHFEAADEYFINAMNFVDNYVKKHISEPVRKSYLTKEVQENIKSMAKEIKESLKNINEQSQKRTNLLNKMNLLNKILKL